MTGGWIDLYWLPLGAGGHFVRRNGRAYEWWVSRLEHRAPLDLYHAGLVIRQDDVDYAVEMGPVWNVRQPDRGVVCEGPVGSPWLGRFRAFRYEVRCWAGGFLPDAAEAVGGPRRVAEDPAVVADSLMMVREVPVLTWGRDELGTGEMWNSNSLVAYVLARTGVDAAALSAPPGGRAPGWGAGIAAASRSCRRGA
ncbi:MAG TPA: hypothetical protein VFK52_00955 [Nocardioidaceae bacterium]|nr:hypothetical protein [Nocardioidaceae bacterium]